MILQETILLGFLAFIFGNIFAHLIYDRFPKRVLLNSNDAGILFIIVLVSSVLSSLIGIYKVIKVNPQEAIGG
jgi:putative ABC transport system permease protein